MLRKNHSLILPLVFRLSDFNTESPLVGERISRSPFIHEEHEIK
jgi:hypothetical protein